jgi:hypothetical protein
MIIKSFDLYDFKREFERYNRGNNFSDEALEELYNYYDNLGEPYELDIIEICCNWTEYENLEEYAKEYMNESDFEGMDDDEKEEIILDNLDNNTYFTRLYNGSILIQNY